MGPAREIVMREYDPHEFCRREINKAYAAAADRTRIQQVIKQRPDGKVMVVTNSITTFWRSSAWICSKMAFGL